MSIRAITTQVTKTVNFQTVVARSTEYEFYDEPAGQEIRRDVRTWRLVILIQAMFDREVDIPEEHLSMPWLVKDVLEGHIYVLEIDRIGARIFNEMEALAWAAEDHPDVEIQGD